jgi:hypothetical protein
MNPEATVNEILDSIRAIEDPVERFKAATAALEVARISFVSGARQVRQDVVNELRAQDMSLADIATALGDGLTRSRIQQISEGRSGGKPRESADGS